MPRTLTRLEHENTVKEHLHGESPLWFLFSVGVSTGVVWLYGSWREQRFDVPGLMEVVIGASVGAFLELSRRFASHKKASYEVYKEFAEEAEETEKDLRAEISVLTATLSAEQAKNANPIRRKNQAISDGLREFHRLGIELLNTRVDDNEGRLAFKVKWQQFRTDLYGAMTALGCSDSEIHKVKHPGAVPMLPSYPKTHRSALAMKSELIFVLDRIGEIADSHDTTKPA